MTKMLKNFNRISPMGWKRGKVCAIRHGTKFWRKGPEPGTKFSLKVFVLLQLPNNILPLWHIEPDILMYILYVISHLSHLQQKGPREHGQPRLFFCVGCPRENRKTLGWNHYSNFSSYRGNRLNVDQKS